MKLLNTRERALSFEEAGASSPSTGCDLRFSCGVEISTPSMVPLSPESVATPKVFALEKGEEEGAATAEVGEGRDGLHERRM